MNKKIAVLAGDGIGPEVTSQSIKVLHAIANRYEHGFIFEEALVGAVAIDDGGDPYPESTHELCVQADAILFGAIGDPKYDNDPTAKVRPEQGLLRMRKALGLYANIRPVKHYDILTDASPLKADRIKGSDFVVYRELTGGIYFGSPRGRSEDGRTAYDSSVYSVEEIERIAKMAFEAAKLRPQKRLTLVDKANVLATSRLWREVVSAMAKDYPDIAYDTMFVDNAAMQLIQNPGYFDVVLTENMFGDILTDEASVITGSLGMLPSASVGDKAALYEPIHGSYPQAAGKNIANPFASILSAAMMLELSFGMVQEAASIRNAVEKCMDEGLVTADIQGGSATTTEVGDRVAELVKSV
jgi:3-isopropylmalate dehydrogenase